MEYRGGDVRDIDALRAAFEGADVVVHLAFLIVGGNKASTRSINIQGTLNAFRAAAAAGVRRFILAIPLPARPAYAAARALCRVPFLPTTAGWVEAVSHPSCGTHGTSSRSPEVLIVPQLCAVDERVHDGRERGTLIG